MNKIKQLVEQSPIFRCRARDKQGLILDLIDVLDQYPNGLHHGSLRRELTATKKYPGEWLAKELERTLEACGVFRATAQGKFAMVPAAALEKPIDEMPVVVMDFEATGGRPPLHRFIEVALIRREPDGTETYYESLANPRRPLPWYVTKITGLTERQVREAPPVENVLDEVIPYLEGALLVFHGSASDMELLCYEIFQRTGQLLANPVMCTIALTRELEPELKTLGLDRVAQHFGIAVETQHRAMDDALLTLQLYDRFSERFAGADLTYLVDAAFFQGNLPVPPFLTTNLSVDLLNSLPAGPAAFVLRDEARRVLQASGTENLRRDLGSLFFPRNVLEPDLKVVARNSRFLDYKVIAHPSQAETVLDEMLAGALRHAPLPRGRSVRRGARL